MTKNNVPFKAGFVSILGRPNAGKSTLMNQLVGEKLSIITPKAQTTRHRIHGILTTDTFQIVFSDTPGLIENPVYRLHEKMNEAVREGLSDADLVLVILDITSPLDSTVEALIIEILGQNIPLLLVVNKCDAVNQAKANSYLNDLNSKFPSQNVFPISALHGANLPGLMEAIVNKLPIHPPYYPDEDLTTRPERFFAAEIIREKIFQLYDKEVPYSCEVVVTAWQEEPQIHRILAEIWVSRPTQKNIIIGKAGAAIKQVGTLARKDIEELTQKKVYLELHVRIKENWRNNPSELKNLGY